MKYLAKKQRAQSFVEMALFMPIMLLLLAGMVEVTFMFNDYLQLLDAVRYGARDSSDNNPYPAAFPVTGSDFDPTIKSAYDHITYTASAPANYAPYIVWDCNNTLNFFAVAACNVDNNLSYLSLTKDGGSRNDCSASPNVNAIFRDDIVISLFASEYTSGTKTITGTPPKLKRFAGNAVVVSGTVQVGQLSDNRQYITSSVTTASSPGAEDTDESGWSYLQQMCSAISTQQVKDKLINSAPSTGFLLVEVFYARRKTLDFPFVGDLIPNPIPLHAYAIFPLVAIEPTKTPKP